MIHTDYFQLTLPEGWVLDQPDDQPIPFIAKGPRGETLTASSERLKGDWPDKLRVELMKELEEQEVTEMHAAEHEPHNAVVMPTKKTTLESGTTLYEVILAPENQSSLDARYILIRNSTIVNVRVQIPQINSSTIPASIHNAIVGIEWYE